MALIVDKRAAERRLKVTSVVESQELYERDYEQRYGAALLCVIRKGSYNFLVYYRVYDDEGEIVSKTSFDENNSSLGRVNTLSVPPPHTVSSLKKCIIISEDLSGHD